MFRKGFLLVNQIRYIWLFVDIEKDAWGFPKDYDVYKS